MKKFFNILVALSALGLVVGCKPAGNTGAKAKRHANDGETPESVLKEYLVDPNFIWLGQVDIDGRGFYWDESENNLYMYCDEDRSDSYFTKDLETTWKTVLANYSEQKNQKWHLVKCCDENLFQFTVPTFEGDKYVYELTEEKTAVIRREKDAVDESKTIGYFKVHIALPVTDTTNLKALEVYNRDTNIAWFELKDGVSYAHAFVFRFKDGKEILFDSDSNPSGNVHKIWKEIKSGMANPDDPKWGVAYQDPAYPHAWHIWSRLTHKHQVLNLDDTVGHMSVYDYTYLYDGGKFNKGNYRAGYPH